MKKKKRKKKNQHANTRLKMWKCEWPQYTDTHTNTHTPIHTCLLKLIARGACATRSKSSLRGESERGDREAKSLKRQQRRRFPFLRLRLVVVVVVITVVVIVVVIVAAAVKLVLRTVFLLFFWISWGFVFNFTLFWGHRRQTRAALAVDQVVHTDTHTLPVSLFMQNTCGPLKTRI